MSKTLLSKPVLILLLAACAGFGGAAVAADADPTLPQVYEAANSGHLDQAQGMMARVLKDHPNSAKAHYVAAELDARQGKLAVARDEFQTAERLEPGLPFAKPESLNELRAQLYPQQRATPVNSIAPIPAHSSGIPWGMVFGIGLIAAIAWMLLRRRQQAVMPGGGYAGPGAGGAPYGGGYGNGYPPPSGGGPGLLGSLGTGLAVGAGVVAGEELAHRFLDGGERRVEGGGDSYREPQRDNTNADMGGNDFGVNDTSSWDDGGGDSGGGGGDDSWS